MLFNKKEPRAASVAPMTDGTSAPAHVPPAEISFDVTTDNFQARVLDMSMQVPVIVDFWAPWCGPCKQLMPALEQAVQAAGGKVLLAKVNIDDHQELAAALRVQSVPTVFGFFQGQPIDAFQGNVPPSQIKAFIDKLIEAGRAGQPDALDIPEALTQASSALAAGDVQTAHQLYSHILQEDQTHGEAYAGLVRTFIAAGQMEQAAQMIEHVPEDIAKLHAFAQAKTAMELASATPDAPLEVLAQSVESDPKDPEARFALANALYSSGARAEAIDHLLILFEHDREWNEQAARTQLLKYFDAMGPTDPLTLRGRKKLSTLLFS